MLTDHHLHLTNHKEDNPKIPAPDYGGIGAKERNDKAASTSQLHRTDTLEYFNKITSEHHLLKGVSHMKCKC